jgi:hypothetical protein
LRRARPISGQSAWAARRPALRQLPRCPRRGPRSARRLRRLDPRPRLLRMAAPRGVQVLPPGRHPPRRHHLAPARAAEPPALSALSRRRLGGRRLRPSRQDLPARPLGRRLSRQDLPVLPRRPLASRRRGRPSRLALLVRAWLAAPRHLPPAVLRQRPPRRAPLAAAQVAGRRTSLHAGLLVACLRAARGRPLRCALRRSLLRCGLPRCLPIGGRPRGTRRAATPRLHLATQACRGSRPRAVRPRPRLRPRPPQVRRRLQRTPRRQGGAWRRLPGAARHARRRRLTSATLAILPGRRPMSRRRSQAPPPRPPLRWRLRRRPGRRTMTATRRPAGPPRRSQSPSLPSRIRRAPKSPTLLAAGDGPIAPRRALLQLRQLLMCAWSLMTPGPPIAGPSIGAGRATMRADRAAAATRLGPARRRAAGALAGAPAFGRSAMMLGSPAAMAALTLRGRRAASIVARTEAPPAPQRRLPRARRTRKATRMTLAPQDRRLRRRLRHSRQRPRLVLRRARPRPLLAPLLHGGLRPPRRPSLRPARRRGRRAPTPRRVPLPARRCALVHTRTCGPRRRPPRRPVLVPPQIRRLCLRRQGSSPHRRRPRLPAPAPWPCLKRTRAPRRRSPLRAARATGRT